MFAILGKSNIFSFIIVKKNSTSSYGGLDCMKLNVIQGYQRIGLLINIPERCKPREMSSIFGIGFPLEAISNPKSCS